MAAEFVDAPGVTAREQAEPEAGHRRGGVLAGGKPKIYCAGLTGGVCGGQSMSLFPDWDDPAGRHLCVASDMVRCGQKRSVGKEDGNGTTLESRQAGGTGEGGWRAMSATMAPVTERHIRFTVWGEAVPQGRPRATVISGRARLYDPAKSRSYKSLVQDAAMAVRPETPITGPVAVAVRIYKTPPKSLSKKRLAAALAGDLKPTTKPDCSNILKGIEDALNGLIWRDDSQIVDLQASKHYSDRPRVDVEIWELEGVG